MEKELQLKKVQTEKKEVLEIITLTWCTLLLAWEVYICVLVLLHANRSGHKFYKSVSEPLKK